MAKEKKIPIPTSLTEGHMTPQAETLAIEHKRGSLYIGIPKVETNLENRIALVPAAVQALTSQGHRVVIEAGAGARANYSDHRYAEAGAEIVYEKDKVFNAHVMLLVAPPTLEEISRFHPNQVIISPLHLPAITEDFIDALRKKKVIALAMEYIQDDSGSFPFVRVMSEIAGMSAMLTAAEMLATTSGGKGVLLGGIAGVPAAKVVILGAGVVGESAVRVALGLGADVRVFDNNVYKLMRLQQNVGQRVNTSTFNPAQLEKELLNADVVIGAVHSKSGRAPIIVTEHHIAQMKTGSVVVDVSIDQGGCIETSEMTTHEKPTFIKHGIIHYCVPNIASKVPRTASIAISNILVPLLLAAGKQGGVEDLLYDHAGLRNGVYIYLGRLTNAYIGNRFGMKFTNIDLLITSQL